MIFTNSEPSSPLDQKIPNDSRDGRLPCSYGSQKRSAFQRHSSFTRCFRSVDISSQHGLIIPRHFSLYAVPATYLQYSLGRRGKGQRRRINGKRKNCRHGIADLSDLDYCPFVEPRPGRVKRRHWSWFLQHFLLLARKGIIIHVVGDATRTQRFKLNRDSILRCRKPNQNSCLLFYHAPTSKFSCSVKLAVFPPWSMGNLTSGKNVVTTVLSANFLPARAWRAFFAEAGVSYLTKILPTPADCRLPPLGRGTFNARI